MDLNTITTFVLGMGVGYVIVSLAESWLHNKVQHARTRTRRFWNRYAIPGRLFHRSYYSHHVVHHFRTFRDCYTRQFRDDLEQRKLDASLPADIADAIINERYGLTIKGFGIFRYVAPILPSFVILFMFTSWAFFFGTLVFAIIYPLLSKIIHPWLHCTYANINTEAPWLLPWLFRTKYVKAMVINHYMHHRYLYCNYNLLLGGDYLLGTHREASPEDLHDMRTMGLLID